MKSSTSTLTFSPEEQHELIKALQDQTLYDHPVNNLSVIETHISWVILTGHFAYKIKKPVNFGFVDFSTLEKRQFFCNEELRLNRQFAPDLYLQVVSIRGSTGKPHLGGEGEVIEYAVKMREFSQHRLLSSYASERRLQSSHIDSMADVIADFHGKATTAEADTVFGSPDTILKWSRENIEQIESAVPRKLLPKYFGHLQTGCLALDEKLLQAMNHRKNHGYIRLCHGDLHLGNMAVIENTIRPFDCIEFNQELHWIDTISEIAFVAMDLQACGYPGFSWRFIDRYLQVSGDYNGITVLRYYIIYRALVRAKVEALSVQQHNPPSMVNSIKYEAAMHYLQLANSWLNQSRPVLILMHGLSGSGKSTVAKQLVEALGAIQIRSDIERKRLVGLNSYDRSCSDIGQGIYSKDVTEQTYDRLADLAGTIIQAGYNVIVDATFLKQSQRSRFITLAQENQIPYLIISCEAPVGVLQNRIKQRKETGVDPSEATIDVLQGQLQSLQILSGQERDNTIVTSSTKPGLGDEQMDTLINDIARKSGQHVFFALD